MPFSLVILYSNDRQRQLAKTLKLLEDTPEYAACDKILCVDGAATWRPTGFKILEIERRTPHYCWADALNTGVSIARNSRVFYFDSDRIVPVNFFTESLKILERHEAFVFPRQLYSVKSDASVKTLREMRDNPRRHLRSLKPDHRVLDPGILGHKNPFAGCVGFQRHVFLRFGGFDDRFTGWGYPDYDYFMTIFTRHRHAIYPLDMTELHQHHGYRDNQRVIDMHSLWNCHQYVQKWQIGQDYLHRVQKQFKVADADLQNSNTLDEFLARVLPVCSQLEAGKLTESGIGLAD